MCGNEFTKTLECVWYMGMGMEIGWEWRYIAIQCSRDKSKILMRARFSFHTNEIFYSYSHSKEIIITHKGMRIELISYSHFLSQCFKHDLEVWQVHPQEHSILESCFEVGLRGSCVCVGACLKVNTESSALLFNDVQSILDPSIYRLATLMDYQ